MISQRPQIAEAMRRALAIPEGFQLSADSVIVPTFNVGTVDSSTDPAFRDAVGYVVIGPVAAQYSRAQLQFIRRLDVERIDVRRITISATATSEAYVGWGSLQPVGLGTEQYKQQTPAGASVTTACDVLGDAAATVPVGSEHGRVVLLTATTENVLDLREEPYTMRDLGTGAAPGLNVAISSVNVGLRVVFEWREWLRAV